MAGLSEFNYLVSLTDHKLQAFICFISPLTTVFIINYESDMSSLFTDTTYCYLLNVVLTPQLVLGGKEIKLKWILNSFVWNYCINTSLC